MKFTVKFRLHPTTSQEQKLLDIFKIYNKVKQMGYKKLLKLKDTELKKNEKLRLVQPQLMEICNNNPYVDNLLQDFRSNEKIIINEVCLEYNNE
ncbi:MAG: hypothetical protein KGD63_03450 [Candidatus Lokiarchaeota archaeon]|nr:hypothetical protein [Candidatus Lokiarchaeota archaeon]